MNAVELRTLKEALDEMNRLQRGLRRLLDPEDLGLAVTAHVRDEVRVLLGMAPCERKENAHGN